jgi:hypothetical protein
LGELAVRTIRLLVSLLVPVALTVSLPAASRAQVVVDVRITSAPPPLPVYVQPVIAGPDYIWSPGYWAWGRYGYYWVPGTWVLAPAVGLLWTPGYWGWNDGVYVWRTGYWGPRVGFYGGINYGYGYTGLGFQGGYWNRGVFAYNTAVTNVGSVQITNVYNKTVINNTTVTNMSFNGGKGGTTVQPTPQEQAAAKDKHIPATGLQTQHEHAASTNHALLASVNHGRPAVAATAKAGQFSGQGIVAAKGVKTLAQPGNTAKVATGAPGPKKPPPQFNAAKMSGMPGTKPPQQQVKRPDPHAKPGP